MSASIRSRAALFGPFVGTLLLLSGCPESPDLGEIQPPQPPPDFSIAVDFGFEPGEAEPDADGVITAGDFPVTAKIRGGMMALPDNPDLVRERTQAYLVAEGDTAEITFTSPAKSFEFFFRHELDPPVAAAAAKATRQVDCGVFDLGLNNGAAFGGQVFARGAFNGWAGASADPPSNFVNNGNGTYSAEFDMVTGDYGFKIAVEDWSTEYSNEGAESLVPDAPIAFPISGDGAGNSTINIPADGCYTWTISNIDDSATPTPSFTLEIAEKVEQGAGAAGSEVKVYDTYGDEIATFPGSTLYKLVGVDVDTNAGEALISRIEIINTAAAATNVRAVFDQLEKTQTRQACGVDDQGNDNAEFFGAEMGIRGSLNDWGFGPPTNLVNFGAGNFQAEFELTAGGYELKIADEAFSIEYSDDSPIVVESVSTIDLSAAGSGNASIEIPEDGCYNWSVTIVDSSSSPAPTLELLVTKVTEDDGPTGETGVGFVAIDDFSFRADAQATRTINVVYARPDGDFSGTEITVSGEDLASGNETLTCEPVFGIPGFCAVQVRLIPGGTFQYSIANNGVSDQSGLITVDAIDISPDDVVITFAGSGVPVTRGIPVAPLANEVILFYKRSDDNYDGWGLHLFPDGSTGWTNFTGGEYPPSGIDPINGAYFIIALPGSPRLSEPYSRCSTVDAEDGCDLSEFPARLGFIIHNGDAKDPGPDQFVNIAQDGNIIFVTSGVNRVATTPPVDGGVVRADAAAHWVTQDTVVWDAPAEASGAQLLYSADGGIREAGGRLIGADMSFDLSAGSSPTLPNSTHLEGLAPWAVPGAALDMIDVLITGQLIAVALDDQGAQVAATAVQIPLVLDDLFAQAAADATLGVDYSSGSPALSVWAPTSTMVWANIYDTATAETASETLPMNYDDTTGVWSIDGSSAWDRKYYTYTVTNYVPLQSRVLDQETTDPYSINIANGGTSMARSQIINLDDADLKPADWDTFEKPALEAPEDIVIYELHLRDFSALDDSVMPADRGKYTAFAGNGSGTAHLADLAAAGLTHVHIMPAFDIATVNEDETQRVDLDDPIADLCALNPAAQPFCDIHSGTIEEALDSYAGDSTEQQELIEVLRDFDSFNWGYDPVHFNTPEGSYASDANNESRILEFRQMVKGLSDIGLRTALDQVYNHTTASGTNTNAVFDKVVPGYYHRYDAETGNILRETCCDDTAAEHAMMGKFVADSIVFWARHYKIDAFRIDLMSLHPLSVMEQARDRAQELTLADDGVDGSKIYIYGEGWLTGVAQNDSRFIGASQNNLAGSGIGSFNDRIRDGVRGGGPFDSGGSHITNQGFISGLFYDPNANNSGSAEELNDVLFNADRIRFALAGALSDYVITDHNDNMVGGSSGLGYTADPQEIINYVASHDNETLWDISQYKHPTGTPTADRVRAHNVGNAIVLLSQGVPFLHAGQDLLRSKSMDRNSFDSGDWFNYLDFTAEDNNFAVGLPPAGDNGGSYTEAAAALANAAALPGAADIMLARDVTQEFLQIRKSTGLFRLQTASDIISRVQFHNTGSAGVPGLIVMSIDGCVDGEFIPEYGSVVAVFNANDEAQVFDLFGDRTFDLHPVQMSSVDSTAAAAFHDATGFNVPARTAAVFVETQSGIACGCAPVEDAGLDNAEAFGAELFARGGFNGWGAAEPSNFTNLGDGNYKSRFAMSAGTYDFKLADEGWTFEYTNSGAVTVGTAVDFPSGGGSNASITIDEDGCYEWTATIVDGSAVPAPLISLLVERVVEDDTVACQAPADLGNDPAEAFGAELFARGGFNGWAGVSSDPPTNFVNLGGGVYQARFGMTAGTYEFKLADEGWSFEYTNSGTVTVGTATDLLGGGGGNASITIAADGCYQWTVAVVDGSAVPAPLVSLLVEDLASGCAPPEDVGEDPAEAFGAELFARGGFNGWAGAASDPPTNFVNLGGGVYQARFSMSAGPYEFKLADDGWSFEYTNSGSVPVGMATDLPSGGGGNVSITIPADGCYRWTVTIVDGSAVPAPLVSLLVESDAGCPAPPDLGNDPAAAFGAELFARGGFNGWAGAASDPPTNFVNLGGAYMARFSMSAGTFEFKLADDGWSFEYTNGGSVPVGMATDLPGGGGSNVSITIPADGCYQWTLQILDDAAVPAPLVRLLVEQIPTVRANSGSRAMMSPVSITDPFRDDPISALLGLRARVVHRLETQLSSAWLRAGAP